MNKADKEFNKERMDTTASTGSSSSNSSDKNYKSNMVDQDSSCSTYFQPKISNQNNNLSNNFKANNSKSGQKDKESLENVFSGLKGHLNSKNGQ